MRQSGEGCANGKEAVKHYMVLKYIKVPSYLRSVRIEEFQRVRLRSGSRKVLSIYSLTFPVHIGSREAVGNRTSL